MSFILIIFLSILFVSLEGKNQDSRWLQDYQKYITADDQLENGNLQQAFNLYDALLADPSYQYSASINLKIGTILRETGRYDQAQQYFDKAKNICPAVVRYVHFLQEYSLVTYYMNEYDIATKYLDRINVISNEESHRQWVSDLKEAIELAQKKK